MSWIIDIKSNSNFTLNNGFKIIDYDESGMFKSCILSYRNFFELEYYYERGPVHADIIYDEKRIGLIHCANFLNDKNSKYEFPEYFWKNRANSNAEYISCFDKILSNELDKILEWIFKLDDNKWNEFVEYYQNENLKNLPGI